MGSWGGWFTNEPTQLHSCIIVYVWTTMKAVKNWFSPNWFFGEKNSILLASTNSFVGDILSAIKIWVDAKSTTSYSSDLHFSVFPNRPNRGALICLKFFLKISKIGQKFKNGICRIKKVDNALFLSILYAPNITNIRFFNLGLTLSS